MALDLTGIVNQNDYYTDHYLREILESDLKDLFSEWRAQAEEEGRTAPDQALRSLAQSYFSAKSNLERIRNLPELLEAQTAFLGELLGALSYERRPAVKSGESGVSIPIVGEICKPGGGPRLWILEAATSVLEPEDPLQQTILENQYAELPENCPEQPWVDIITRQVFGLADPPRWVLLLDFNTILLIDRSKWNEKRLLRFDLDEIFGRRETSTFRAMAALLHRESVCPDDGEPLLDTLDEQSHKHAYQVSEDLKYSVREAIELIGNEALYYLREVRHEGIYGKQYSDRITLECLRYMYRLLFLLYLEARPELGYADMKSEVYRSGYSFESLRDLEIVPLTTEESRNGYYLHESVSMLFRLVYDGYEPSQNLALLGRDESLHNSFTIPPLKSHLFDPERTPLLNRVKLRNFVLQRVLELMSLSRPKNGKKNRRGRISYAQLGINQLGAVYEGLLSYTGFFAETDLYEVKRADQQTVNELDHAFFVTEEDLDKYTEDEKVFNTAEDVKHNPLWKPGTLRKYPKGTFIYRLSGRQRQRSASYYTPEVLTQCLVKYALKELLKGKTADDILNLTVCEPAMGSAAFLNEAINQLADAYMQRKQRELDEVLPPDEYVLERQKVKMLLADRNVFGVDLNPIAVELAEVSLWLNSIHAGGFVPWFGMQLASGNSLIGARRQMFDSALLRKKARDEPSWMDEVPQRHWPEDAGAQPPESEVDDRKGKVYHFLLPDPGMANYNNKVVKGLAPEQIKTINTWRKQFTVPFSESDIRLLEKLSDTIDKLWAGHTDQLRKLREQTTDPIGIYGHPASAGVEATPTRIKDARRNQEILSENVRASSLYRRLKLAMDYWCALWFWPIEKADLLPDRGQYLSDLQLILEGELVDILPQEDTQMDLFPTTVSKQEMLALQDAYGFVDVDKLAAEVPRIGLVKQLTERYHFLHWELEFADVFADRGGFAMVLGNPPWIKVEWQEGGIMGDLDPLFVLRKFSASKLAQLRADALERFDAVGPYLDEFEGQTATQHYLNAFQNYPVLSGSQSNLYKCFLPQAWYMGADGGMVGFLHPEGVYDDPKGGELRRAAYPRLRNHFQFDNELRLFAEVHHCTKFSVNIYRSEASEEARFDHIANLYAVPTVNACYAHDVHGQVGGIKDEDGKWNVVGHRDRIVHVNQDLLALFARLYDTPGTPALEARLPAVHAVQVVDVLRKFADYPKRLGDLEDAYTSTEMWHETNAQTDGTIRRETRFPQDPSEWILSGPHFYVGTPLNKSPRQTCTQNSHYDPIDLTIIPDDYLPRTNYVPNCNPAEYRRRIPDVPWKPGAKVTDYYRVIYRGMLSQAGERTLIASVLPENCGHINGAQTTAFQNNAKMLATASLTSSLVADFYVKTTGRSNLHYIWEALAIPELSAPAYHRTLPLCCVTEAFAGLWRGTFDSTIRQDRWAKHDLRLPEDTFAQMSPDWSRWCALRTAYERRQALVEIDVLVAMALALTVDELCAIYRIQFPVLRQNEADTWYDHNGRIIFTSSKGLPGVGLTRPEWNEAKSMTSGSIEQWVTCDIMPDYRKAHAHIRLVNGTELDCPCPDYPDAIPGPVERRIIYQAPFDRCDREADYRTAWAEFKRRGL